MGALDASRHHPWCEQLDSMTAVEARYFPASALFSDGSTWRAVYVVIARGGEHEGLHVWRQPGDEPTFRAGVDWARTRIPTRRLAKNGVSVYTDVGLVVVTPGSGCRCGRLGRWRGPSWGNMVHV